MKLAAYLLARSSHLAHRHVVPSLNLTEHSIKPTTAQWAQYSTRNGSIEYGWGTDILDEMRSAAKSDRWKLPKTWASTHGVKSQGDDASTATTRTGRQRRGEAKWNAFLWKKTPAQLAREAEQEELERGLEVYTHKSPVGPPHIAGSSFLAALCKPSSSSHTLDQPLLPDGTSSGTETARLRTPMLAYTANHDEAQDLLSCLGPGPMGLDLEWNVTRSGGAQRTALLQICSSSLILIIHLSAMSHRIPPLLTTILQDPGIIKTGVAIRNDALKLQRDYAIDTRCIVELSALAKLAQPRMWGHVRHLISLRDLTRVYLGRRLRKDAVRVSDWERYPLEAQQIEYAASDTFASLEVLRAVAEYFRPSGERQVLLERLDRVGCAGDSAPMDLELALKRSAYDLYHERVGISLERQKRERARTALREVRPQARPASPKQVRPGQAASRSDKQNTTQDSDDDDDFVAVTSIRLAHDRAMHQWLYANQTLDQVAQAANVKPTTVASYLLKALVQAKEKRDKAEDGQRGLLDDFAPGDRERLESELKQAGPSFLVHQRRYRGLAKQLGWMDASGSGSEGEDGQQMAKTSKRVAESSGKSASQQRTKASSAEKPSRPPIVVELSSDDEVDVNETSR